MARNHIDDVISTATKQYRESDYVSRAADLLLGEASEKPGKVKLGPGDKAMIRHVMGRVHVGTPDEEVVANFKNRLAKAEKGRKEPYPASFHKEVINHALKCHRENQKGYNTVMRGFN